HVPLHRQAEPAARSLGESVLGRRQRAALRRSGADHQLSAPPVRYSVTRVSKKFFSFLRSTISLIHGSGFAACGNSGGKPICWRRRLATKRKYASTVAALSPSTPRGSESRA